MVLNVCAYSATSNDLVRVLISSRVAFSVGTPAQLFDGFGSKGRCPLYRMRFAMVLFFVVKLEGRYNVFHLQSVYSIGKVW